MAKKELVVKQVKSSDVEAVAAALQNAQGKAGISKIICSALFGGVEASL